MNTVKKILIVDDDADIREALKLKFQKNGLEIAEAASGDEALGKVLTDDYAVMLLDLKIPGKDGLALLQEIKGDEKLKKIKVIIFTNFSSQLNIKQALELGAEKALLKANISIDEIVKTVIALISRP